MTVLYGDSKPIFKHNIPFYMVNGPHQVHLDGMLMQPGIQNDYNINRGEQTSLSWWNESWTEDSVISITRLDTGERWAMTKIHGVFVDTRRKLC